MANKTKIKPKGIKCSHPVDDIPQDTPQEAPECRIEALQNLVYKLILSRSDASWLYLHITGSNKEFKKSRFGWSIEDRIKAKPFRMQIAAKMASKYPTKFTLRELKNFI